MSAKRKNGEAIAIETPEDDTQTWGEKRKPQPRMVKDPLTGEVRPENKQEKFERLAERRVDRAVAAIERIKTLANKVQYAYDDQDAAAVVDELMRAVNVVRNTFAGNQARVTGFKLRGAAAQAG